MVPTQVVRMVAPFAALGVTWLARRSLETAYTATTGNDLPRASDPDTPLRTALFWAIATTSIVAVTNVMVDRWVGEHERRAELESAAEDAVQPA